MKTPSEKMEAQAKQQSWRLAAKCRNKRIMPQACRARNTAKCSYCR
jgi:hypothetical protein